MEKEQEERNEMTKEQATVDTRDLEYQIGVMQAFKAGAQIESRLRDRSGWVWQKQSNPSWDWFSFEFRIKPTPTLRPWTADEVPLGAFIRPKEGSWRSLILAVDSDERINVNCGGFPLGFALENHEHSLDGGKTWKPCGVEEETK